MEFSRRLPSPAAAGLHIPAPWPGLCAAMGPLDPMKPNPFAAPADPVLLFVAVAWLAGLLGTVALAETRLQAFELEIAQPLHPGAGRPKKGLIPDPGKELIRTGATSGAWGTDTGYLMARLQRIDPVVARLGMTTRGNLIEHPTEPPCPPP